MPIPENGIPEKILWIVGYVVGFIETTARIIKSKI